MPAMGVRMVCVNACEHGATYLFHDAGFALGKCNVTTRLVLDELDLDLSAFSSTLLVVIIIVISSH